MDLNHFKCTYVGKIMGTCNNQNFGRRYCFYHDKVVNGLIVPESTSVTLSSLPSYNNLGDD